MPREVDHASFLRHEAAALLERAKRVKTASGREQLRLWAQELNDKADELEMTAAEYVTKH
jgi:hypothetical protein